MAAEPSNVVVLAMLEGFAAQGSWGAMGSFAQSLSDEQIADLANYVRTALGECGTSECHSLDGAELAEICRSPADWLACAALS